MNKLVVKQYNYETQKIKNPFRIVLIADLHSYEYGPDNAVLVEKCKEMNPEIICIVGDLISARKMNVQKTVRLLNSLTKICQVFFVNGNHETNIRETGEYKDFEKGLYSTNVMVLNNQYAVVEINGNQVCLSGIELPMSKYGKKEKSLSLNELPEVHTNFFHILLTHNPEFAETYFDYGADLVLSGHFHGGIYRFGEQGLLSPYYNFFPKYSYGQHYREQHCIIISGGLEDHSIRRIWNPYELVQVDCLPTTDQKE